MAQTGSTRITEWQYGKNGAVSITYDDASRHQFTRALPVMERLKIPATFFVITGPITGSRYQGKFVGRPVEVIIKESASVPTNENNFPFHIIPVQAVCIRRAKNNRLII
jgi:hypothetical protein